MVIAFIFFTSVRRGYSGGSLAKCALAQCALAQCALVQRTNFASSSFPRRHLFISKNHAKHTKEERRKKNKEKEGFSLLFTPYSLLYALCICVILTQGRNFGVKLYQNDTVIQKISHIWVYRVLFFVLCSLFFVI
jgi:hypothetical protein